eukprot:TRINITY_DN69233_c0_g1_i1.p1 TRINITY_DN69233_c0_g1~~TRINITY_DN69233_c0_g1_i1.p1  ORF type:complete len:339 (+),score=48.40 TRINITY_DN69233_c0_g1_i1:44-1018(+)
MAASMSQRSRSDPSLLRTRREMFGRSEGHIGGAIAGYSGHVPAMQIEDATCGLRFSRAIEASRAERSRPTFDAQAQRLSDERAERRAKSSAAQQRKVAPATDNRGVTFPAAGDFRFSRIPVEGEEKDEAHFNSSMGLTSFSHENRGAAEKLRGFGRAARGLPSYGGHVPGKLAENMHGETWSKSSENSIAAYFAGRNAAPKQVGLLTNGGTIIAPVHSDLLKEKPLFNPSYQDRIRGWSDCQFTGTAIESAGRQAPRDRQEGFTCTPPPVPNVATHGFRGSAIHGYAGWVPGRVGESVVGERQCKTNAVSDHLFRKANLRITQR